MSGRAHPGHRGRHAGRRKGRGRQHSRSGSPGNLGGAAGGVAPPRPAGLRSGVGCALGGETRTRGGASAGGGGALGPRAVGGARGSGLDASWWGGSGRGGSPCLGLPAEGAGLGRGRSWHWWFRGRVSESLESVARGTRVSAASGPSSVTAGFEIPGVRLRGFAGPRVPPRPRVPVPFLRTSRAVLQDVRSRHLGGPRSAPPGGRGHQGLREECLARPRSGPLSWFFWVARAVPSRSKGPTPAPGLCPAFPTAGSLPSLLPFALALNFYSFRCRFKCHSSMEAVLRRVLIGFSSPSPYPPPPLGLARVVTAHHGSASLQTLASRGPDHPSCAQHL